MKRRNLTILLELTSWVATALIVALVLYPIVSVTNNYTFLVPNIIFIVLLVTCTRYIFWFKHTWLAKLQYVKVGIIFVSIWAVFLLVEQLNIFQTTLDEDGASAILGNLSLSQLESLGNYMKSEMIFFGVGSIISLVVLDGRLLKSVWNYRNKGVA